MGGSKRKRGSIMGEMELVNKSIEKISKEIDEM
jgi:hypothetical protein